MHIFLFFIVFFLNISKKKRNKKTIGILLTSVKCIEHFFEPVQLAAFKLVAKFLQESNLKRIGIFMTNITLNKFGK